MKKSKQDKLSHDAIVKALLENYESIYVVDIETSSFRCFHESDSYSSLHLEDEGDDFFEVLEHNIVKTIYSDDQKFVIDRLSEEVLDESLKKDKFYSFVYRLMIEGKPLYHKLRATKDLVDGRPHYLIGIRNVDAAFRQDKALAEKMAAMHTKEISHLEAILSSAEGYLEVNLTKDIILEVFPYNLPTALKESYSVSENENLLSYDAFMKWHVDNKVVENKDKITKVSNRNYLISCFEHNEKRASVSFSMKAPGNPSQPCRLVFHLYQDISSGDILSFCVLYDLTEQQQKEKELRDLENELQMIRIRNFTSQMQPHFLYNTLGSIQEIMLTDPVYASELIGDFTTHLRSCIRAMSNDSPIPFDQELANIKAYVNIEKMRLGEKLDIVYDIRIRDFLILPLTIQPLVENAIRHGIYERGKQGGKVEIKTEEVYDGSIKITVKDDGIGFNVKEYKAAVSKGVKDSTGLNNIMFRLNKIMHATIDIESTVGTGTKVTVIIPKEEDVYENDHS